VIESENVVFNTDGLVPAIIQNAHSNRVLMLGYMNSEALQLSQSSGKVHFWSRSRNQLWLKGETSGNFLNIKDISVDCDSDALLVLVEPVGNTCHTGTESCFDEHEVTSHE
jgi:phosphoribosyl-ATP pyrophosphohydrolase/phosphoribosyl-AMP cyclohydrolase